MIETKECKECNGELIRYYEDREHQRKNIDVVATLFGFVSALALAIAMVFAMMRLEGLLERIDKTTVRMMAVENMAAERILAMTSEVKK